MHINSLYIHVPFCHRKCAYCVFYSVPVARPEIIQRYLQRLDADLEYAATMCGPLDSIYIGGGTPSLLSIPQCQLLLNSIKHYFTIRAGCEFTFECNPGSLSPAKLETLKSFGVNRISLGVQSFNAEHRRTLGRECKDREIADALEMLAHAATPKLGIDLIYGIPGQSLEDWVADLRTACQKGVHHISAYSLTVDEQSQLARAGIEPTAPDLAVEMWDAAATELKEFGLERYEVSNYAQAGHACRHNLDIWHGKPYIGCGPAAASFDGSVRWAQPPDLNAWLRHEAPYIDELTSEKRAAEILAFGLRTVNGWDLPSFKARTGYDAMALRGQIIRQLCRQNLLECRDARLRPTSKGLLFADQVAVDLL